MDKIDDIEEQTKMLTSKPMLLLNTLRSSLEMMENSLQLRCGKTVLSK